MKIQHQHKVSVDEYNIAFRRWRECRPKNVKGWAWRNFLSDGWNFTADDTVTFQCEKAVTKIKMLNSPHYKALFKAMVIQDEDS